MCYAILYYKMFKSQTCADFNLWLSLKNLKRILLGYRSFLLKKKNSIKDRNQNKLQTKKKRTPEYYEGHIICDLYEHIIIYALVTA